MIDHILLLISMLFSTLDSPVPFLRSRRPSVAVNDFSYCCSSTFTLFSKEKVVVHKIEMMYVLILTWFRWLFTLACLAQNWKIISWFYLLRSLMLPLLLVETFNLKYTVSGSLFCFESIAFCLSKCLPSFTFYSSFCLLVGYRPWTHTFQTFPSST